MPRAHRIVLALLVLVLSITLLCKLHERQEMLRGALRPVVMLVEERV